MNDTIRKSQEAHWSGKFSEHGAAPAGVGSESAVHKELRYSRLCRVFAGSDDFSLLDVGAGVGDFYRYLRERHTALRFDYTGSEITAGYTTLAAERFPEARFLHRDILSEPLDEKYDFVVLSGIFHQPFDTDIVAWETYMHDLLRRSFSMARIGIAFNALSSYAEFQRQGNYHPKLSSLLDFVVSDLSRFFQVDHSIPLFEETIFVFRPEYIGKNFVEPEFQKYLGTGK
ncbi:MAG: class I SAM-dependent methyltransferase [Parvibaculum sp.]|nr:class I SAM-dependent methyltransferase [Parvibaculum sp.]